MNHPLPHSERCGHPPWGILLHGREEAEGEAVEGRAPRGVPEQAFPPPYGPDSRQGAPGWQRWAARAVTLLPAHKVALHTFFAHDCMLRERIQGKLPHVEGKEVG